MIKLLPPEAPDGDASGTVWFAGLQIFELELLEEPAPVDEG